MLHPCPIHARVRYREHILTVSWFGFYVGEEVHDLLSSFTGGDGRGAILLRFHIPHLILT